MAKRINLPKYKRSSSCSEISNGDDTIYEIMSSGEDDDEKTPKTNENIIKKWLNEEITSPLLPPRMRPHSSSVINHKNSPRSFNLFSLSLDKIIQLPIIVEVIDGLCGKDDKNTFAQEEKLMICSKVMTNYVTCVKADVTYNIPINSQYEVSLVNLDPDLNKRTNETAKAILGMVKLPSRIAANSHFEINGNKIAQNQILEVNGGRRDPNAKFLNVQTLSGEDIELPRNMKVTFSCSISARSLPMTIAIESCVFPQTVILMDKTAGRVKKELCTFIDCFSKKVFLACHFKGDVKSSLSGEEALLELPLDLPLTFKVLGKPENSQLVFKKLELLANKGYKITDNDLQIKAPIPIPLPKPDTDLYRSNSIPNLKTYGCRISYEQSPKKEKPSTPQPERPKHFFPNSSCFDRNIESPPPGKPKVNLAKPNSGKIQVKKENPPKLKDKASVKEAEIANNQMIEENIRLIEKIEYLENSLCEKDVINKELEHKLGLVEVALAEANTLNSKHKIQLSLANRTLPPLPGVGRSAPTSPIGLKVEFLNTSKPVNNNPLPLTTKPKIPTKDPYYKCPRDYNIQSPKHEPYSDTVHNNDTAQHLASILEKINFGQYKNKFLQEGINTEMLAGLDEKILEKDLGVKTALHRKKLIMIAEKLKNREDISGFYVDPDYIYGAGKNKLYEKIN